MTNPVIPAEAVEAAARELYYGWDAMTDEARRHATVRITDALEAATPILMTRSPV